MQYRLGTLGYEMLKHQNDYGFDADAAINTYQASPPSASILIPYYEADITINSVLKHMLAAVGNVIERHPNWDYEIILIDDGSQEHPAAVTIERNLCEAIQLVTLPANKGRCYTRNYALVRARYDVAIFIDADVIVHPFLLLDHLRLQGMCMGQRGCISFSLFDFHSVAAIQDIACLLDGHRAPNDWRQACIYDPSWYGCEQDKRFAHTSFLPLADTQMLKHWPVSGFYGPWCITNMVLGGFFTLQRTKAIAVKGCSPLFGSYAFEETSLVTRIVARFHDFIIPLTSHFALHLEDLTIAEPRKDKSALFRAAHRTFFHTFLHQPVTLDELGATPSYSLEGGAERGAEL